MKSSATILLAAFLALSASWGGFILAPQLQLGRADQAKTVPNAENYPIARPGLAHQGEEVYRSLGCVYCHSQQIRQDGVKVEVTLTEAGTNIMATLAGVEKVAPGIFKSEIVAQLPKVIATVSDMNVADVAVKKLITGGGKAEARVIPTGVDIFRNWGMRRTVAQDYVYDSTVQLGSRRAGPDLANIGAPSRKTDVNWHLRHLFAPQAEVKDSTMPAYRFLFEKRKAGKTPSADALALPAGFVPAGFEIIPTDEARALAAYLVSLRAEAPLFEAPITPPAPPAPLTAAAK